MTPCYDQHRLQAFLAGGFSPAEAESLDLHLDGCSTCHELLDRLSQPQRLEPWLRAWADEPAENDGRTRDQQFLAQFRDGAETLSRDGGETTKRSAGDEPLPERIGRWTVIRLLGRGGMGEVFEAYDPQLQRHVAVKRLRPERVAAGMLARAVQEAAAIARLNHPGIVQIHEATQQDDSLYLVLEFVRGGSLADHLRQRQPTPREAAAFLAEVSRAVQYAHEQRIVHRDLKPGNLLLQPLSHAPTPTLADFQPKIADFGVAKLLDVDVRQTQSGVLVGTPAYAAPEQASGRNEDVGPACDVYALGAILYEMLTGRPPFQADSLPLLLRQVIEADPVSPRRLQPGIPLDLETICLTCLQKEPRRRYASAAALADDLKRFLAREPIHARPSTPAERLILWSRRRPAVAALSALLLTFAIVGFSLVLSQWRRAEQANDDLRQTAEQLQRTVTAESTARRQADEARRAETVAKDTAEQNLDESRSYLYFSRVNQAHYEWLVNHNPLTTETLLDHCPAEKRGWEWHYLQRVLHRHLHSVTYKPSWMEYSGLACDPTGRYVAASAAGHTVGLWDVNSGALIRTFAGHQALVRGVAFSPDGTRLASASRDQTVKLWDVASGTLLYTLRHAAEATSVAFSPDGTKLASGGFDHLAKLWDVATGAELVFLRQHWVVTSVAFSPDGQRLAVASDRVVKVWDLQNDDWSTILNGHSNSIMSVAFSPDGQRLATGGMDRTVRIWDAAGQPLHLCRGHIHDVKAVAFSPNGQRVASAGDLTVRLWDVKTGDQADIVRGHKINVCQVAFHPDGKRLATCDIWSHVRIWGYTAPQDCSIFVAMFRTSTALAAGPDSRHFALACGNLVEIWDLASCQIRFRRQWAQEVRSFAFSPDGQLFAWGDTQGTVVVWELGRMANPTDTTDARERFRVGGHQGTVYQLVFDDASQRLFSAGADKAIKVWDATEGQSLQTLEGHSQTVVCLGLLKDGRLVSVARETGQGGEIKLWDLARGQEVGGRRESHVLKAAALDRLHSRLAVVDHDGYLKLWDLGPNCPLDEDTKPFRTLQPANLPLSAVASSPDGQRLAAGGWEQFVRLWDPVTGETAITLRTDDAVQRLAFTPNGRYLIVSSGNMLKVFDGQAATP